MYYPVAVLPAWARAIAEVLPPAHVFESMRAVMAGAPIPWQSLGSAVALDAAYLIAGAAFANAMFRSLRRRGYVTRYAA